ncbi:unnamed protein product [marine sediment metagenome]|uniref:Uncharacterized protein n=1 Tax=marine sediment metagenome TaxID=412755 RepID=X1NZV6_9ZZZZ
MLEDGLHSFLLFAGYMFVVLNGPLLVSIRVRVFAGIPEAPVWLHTTALADDRIAAEEREPRHYPYQDS